MIGDSDNYYILLGLDSAEDNWAVIESKIRSMSANESGAETGYVSEANTRLGGNWNLYRISRAYP